VTLAVRALAAAAVVVAVIGAGAAAHAEEVPNTTIVYRVRQGDSLELIAAEIYGDRAKSVFIMVENKLPRTRALRPGERLRIPISRDITTAPGDTFQSLAGTYLGSTRRAPFLAELNAIPVDASLAAGALITIPMTVVHTAATPESLFEISKMYFGDTRQAELLRRYNFLEKRALDRSESLIVPAYQVRVAAAKQPPLDAESEARRDRRRNATAKAAKALPAAKLAWRMGDYAAVKAALGALEPDLEYLDTSDAVEAGVLLGATYIAHADTELALAIFKRVLDRQSQHVLRRYDHSPRILAVWQAAGGSVE
jgi:hypothetical protein